MTVILPILVSWALHIDYDVFIHTVNSTCSKMHHEMNYGLLQMKDYTE